MESFPPDKPATNVRRVGHVPPVLAIILINFLGNFFFLGGFGFYEDDYLLTLPALNWKWHDYISHVANAIQTWPQGRPFSWALLDTFSYALGSVHNLQFYQIFTFLFSSMAAIFLYHTLCRFTSRFAGLAGTVFYVLYPADTGKQIFMHQAYFPICLILCLLAFRKYNCRSFAWFYFLGAVILLTYEPYFLTLFAAPLLVPTDRARQIRSLFLNGAVLLGVLAVVLVVRKHLGDPRAGDVLGSGFGYLARILTAPAIGLWTALKLAATRPLEALFFNSPWGYVIVALAIYPLVVTLRSQRPDGVAPNGAPAALSPGAVVFAGFVMAAMAYLYRFYPDYYPPIMNIGRLSSIHAVSGLGAAFSFAGVITYAGGRWERITFWLLSVYFALLVSFGLEIQSSQYVRCWDLQKSFFSKVLALTTDAREGETVLVNIDTGFGYDPPFEARPTTEGFPPFWLVNYLQGVLKGLNVYPATWQAPPRLFGFWHGATCTAVNGGVRIGTPPYWTSNLQPVLKNNGFIMLEWKGSELVRRTAAFSFGGVTLTPRPPEVEPGVTRPRGRLYDLFYSHGLADPLWKTLGRSTNYPR